MHPHGRSLGYPCTEPEELDTLPDGRVAYPQDYFLFPTFFYACGVRRCWYAIVLSRVHLAQTFQCEGVAFFDTAWSRSVSSPCHQIVSVSSISVRHVKSFSCLSPYALLSFLRCAQVCFSFSCSVKSLVINSPSPAVHVIRIHGIYDKNRSVLYGMSALLALQIVVTAISCAFYRCKLSLHHVCQCSP
jgi:hypothetical protein